MTECVIYRLDKVTVGVVVRFALDTVCDIQIRSTEPCHESFKCTRMLCIMSCGAVGVHQGAVHDDRGQFKD